MEGAQLGAVALPLSVVLSVLLAVVGFFLKGALGDLKRQTTVIGDLTMRLAVIEARHGTLEDLKTEVHQIRKDIVWVRESLARLGGNNGSS